MSSPAPDVAASYELHIGGHLDQHWSTWFDGFPITHQGDGTVTLRCVVRDQSDLHGFCSTKPVTHRPPPIPRRFE